MDNWTQAIYDATGIPLDEGDLTLTVSGGQGVLALHHYPVLQVGADPDPHNAVTPAIRRSLAQAMEQRLAETLPQVRNLLEAQDARHAKDVKVTVVNPEAAFPLIRFTAPALSVLDSALPPPAEDGEAERGWPHFTLRLSACGFDVEVDLNPYEPDAPFDLDEVRRQVEVILQVVRSSTGPSST
ncbi:MAG: hypothetical protein AAGA48_18580 [Myxococcota bacterium]